MMLHHSAVEGQGLPSESRPLEPLRCQDSDISDDLEVDIPPPDQVEEPIAQQVPGAPKHLPIYHGTLTRPSTWFRGLTQIWLRVPLP